MIIICLTTQIIDNRETGYSNVLVDNVDNVDSVDSVDNVDSVDRVPVQKQVGWGT